MFTASTHTSSGLAQAYSSLLTHQVAFLRQDVRCKEFSLATIHIGSSLLPTEERESLWKIRIQIILRSLINLSIFLKLPFQTPKAPELGASID